MRAFVDNILPVLNAQCSKDSIHHVGLGRHEFSLSFGSVSISGMSKVTFKIDGKKNVWDEVPVSIPVWNLVGQVPNRFELLEQYTLKMTFESGDSVAFHSDESPYEAVVIDFGQSDDALMMEIF